MLALLRTFTAAIAIISLWSVSMPNKYQFGFSIITPAHAQDDGGDDTGLPGISEEGGCVQGGYEEAVRQFDEDIATAEETAEEVDRTDSEAIGDVDSETIRSDTANAASRANYTNCEGSAASADTIMQAYTQGTIVSAIMAIAVTVVGVLIVAQCQTLDTVLMAASAAVVLGTEIASLVIYFNDIQGLKDKLDRSLTAFTGQGVTDEQLSAQESSLNQSIEMYDKVIEKTELRRDLLLAQKIGAWGAAGIAIAVQVFAYIGCIGATLGYAACVSGVLWSCGKITPWAHNEIINDDPIEQFFSPRYAGLWDLPNMMNLMDKVEKNPELLKRSLAVKIKSSQDRVFEQLIANRPMESVSRLMDYNINTATNDIDRFFALQEWHNYSNKGNRYQSMDINTYNAFIEQPMVGAWKEKNINISGGIADSNFGGFNFTAVRSFIEGGLNKMVLSNAYAQDEGTGAGAGPETEAPVSQVTVNPEVDENDAEVEAPEGDMGEALTNGFGIAVGAIAIVLIVVLAVWGSAMLGKIEGIIRGVIWGVFAAYVEVQFSNTQDQLTELQKRRSLLTALRDQLHNFDLPSAAGVEAGEGREGEKGGETALVVPGSEIYTDGFGAGVCLNETSSGNVQKCECNAEGCGDLGFTNIDLGKMDIQLPGQATGLFGEIQNAGDEVASGKGLSSAAKLGRKANRLAAQEMMAEARLKYKKFAEEQGQPPFESLSTQFGSKLKTKIDDAFASFTPAQMDLLNKEFGGLGLDEEKGKKEKDYFSDMLKKKGATGEGAADGNGKKGINLADLMGDDNSPRKKKSFSKEKTASTEDALAKYDLGENDMTKDSGKNIFQIISTRYRRSAFPRFFKKKSKEGDAEKSEEESKK